MCPVPPLLSYKDIITCLNDGRRHMLFVRGRVYGLGLPFVVILLSYTDIHTSICFETDTPTTLLHTAER